MEPFEGERRVCTVPDQHLDTGTIVAFDAHGSVHTEPARDEDGLSRLLREGWNWAGSEGKRCGNGPSAVIGSYMRRPIPYPDADRRSSSSS